jgi:adenine-specific DNA-methyltransferase
LDFYCPAARLAVEIDGGQHNSPEGRGRDEQREIWLQAKGIRVVRFWNHDVLANPEAVLESIWVALQDSGIPPSPTCPIRGTGSPR